jgi:hypothetical protein
MMEMSDRETRESEIKEEEEEKFSEVIDPALD